MRPFESFGGDHPAIERPQTCAPWASNAAPVPLRSKLRPPTLPVRMSRGTRGCPCKPTRSPRSPTVPERCYAPRTLHASRGGAGPGQANDGGARVGPRGQEHSTMESRAWDRAGFSQGDPRQLEVWRGDHRPPDAAAENPASPDCTAVRRERIDETVHTHAAPLRVPDRRRPRPGGGVPVRHPLDTHHSAPRAWARGRGRATHSRARARLFWRDADRRDPSGVQPPLGTPSPGTRRGRAAYLRWV